MRGGLSVARRHVSVFGRRRRRPVLSGNGFTITEVLIVLAVTGALFVSAVVMISGRQSQTAFGQAVRQAQAQIQQTLNEVSTGYFPSNGTFRCVAGAVGAPPTLSSVASSQGTNSGCVFLGKAIQFKISGTDPEEFAIYTVAALKQGGAGGNESTTLAEAKPMVVAPSTSHNSLGYPNITDQQPLQNGLTVSRVWYRNGGGDVDVGAIAFVNGLAQYGGSGELVSGSGRVNVIALDGTTLNTTTLLTAEAMNSDGGNKIAAGTINPSGGVFVCFESGGTKNYGIVQIGGTGRDLTITLNIKNNTGTPCTYP